MTLVDSNVAIDVLTKDPVWLHWSVETLAKRTAFGALCINEVIYAELSIRMDSEAMLSEALAGLKLELTRIPRQALFIAGKIFPRYRAAGGVRTGVLPDFFIGAHAQVAKWPILTRDVRRFRTYFPDVELITPNT
jgi:predicted nucleic acid-binding protein